MSDSLYPEICRQPVADLFIRTAIAFDTSLDHQLSSVVYY